MTSSTSNPLLQGHRLPAFSKIEANHVIPAIETLIAEGRSKVESVLQGLRQGDERPNWDNLLAPLEEENDRLEQAWSPVGHLHAVLNSDALREAYSGAIALLTEYSTELGQHRGLYEAYQALADNDEYAGLAPAQQKVIDNALRDFRLAGVALTEDKQQRYGEIKQRLSELSTQFSNNVLDSTQGWFKHIAEPEGLAGLPESALAQAEQAARAKDLAGYVITLDIPSYLAVMMHADDRGLREQCYRAYVTRASKTSLNSEGRESDEWDNGPLIKETLALRHELAQLLDFNDYAERSLATKMAESSEQVIGFLTELAKDSRPQAQQEWQELQDFARQQHQLDELQPWDLNYYGEKLRQQKYAVSQEELRPYFPVDRVIAGMFEVVKRLFAIDIREAEADCWHPDVRFYQIFRDGELLAEFYLDLFTREHKRGGAWMNDCRVRRRTAEGMQLPVAYLTCNFTPPISDADNPKPSLLTHDEVTTLFHEFGHGLHHMLTQIEWAAVSGINGVPWDAVELPSQFLENWCWQPQVIPLISSHYQTGEPLPEDLLQKMLAAKNFQSAMQMVRQLEFSLFDFCLHAEYDPQSPREPQSLLDDVRQQVAVVIPPAFNKFQNSFSHIFAGGYAAGYYSYKWAEVLSADAFSLFEENGIFDGQTGRDYLSKILQQGGAREPMELFVDFRGREPKVDALLRHCGIKYSAAINAAEER